MAARPAQRCGGPGLSARRLALAGGWSAGWLALASLFAAPAAAAGPVSSAGAASPARPASTAQAPAHKPPPRKPVAAKPAVARAPGTAAKLGGAAAATAAATVAAKPAAPSMQELSGWCQQVTSRLIGPVNVRCQRSGLQAGDGRSVQGVPLWHRDIRPPGTPTLRVLVLGGIHGDEMTSVNVVFDWLERALRQPDLRIHWRMVPLVNPDGLLRQPATRVNARGVDLNRNFPTPDWDSAAHSYWASRTGKDPRRFPGPQAMSEPETRWVQHQLDQFRPHLIVSVHAPYGVLDFDGPPPPPEKMGSLHLDQVGIYPGSLGNYGGVVRRVPVVTIELRNARQVADAEVGAMWSDLLQWIDRRHDQMAALKPLDDPRQARPR